MGLQNGIQQIPLKFEHLIDDLSQKDFLHYAHLSIINNK